MGWNLKNVSFGCAGNSFHDPQNLRSPKFANLNHPSISPEIYRRLKCRKYLLLAAGCQQEPQNLKYPKFGKCSIFVNWPQICRQAKFEKRVIENLKILEFEVLRNYKKLKNAIFPNSTAVSFLPAKFKSGAKFLRDSQKFKNGWFCIWHQKSRKIDFHISVRNTIDRADHRRHFLINRRSRNLKIGDPQSTILNSQFESKKSEKSKKSKNR